MVATGETNTVRSFIELAFSCIDVTIAWKGAGVDEIGYDKSSGKELVKIDPKYFRPTEVELLIGDPTKAKEVRPCPPPPQRPRASRPPPLLQAHRPARHLASARPQKLGWVPTTTMEELCREMVAADIKLVEKGDLTS